MMFDRKKYMKKWRKLNQDRVKASRKHYKESGKKAETNREWRKKTRLKVLTHYGGNPPKCECCGETHIEFLTIDHINNDGAEHRKKLGITQNSGHGSKLYRWIIRNNFPDGFQVLCWNCNCAKGHYGYCPHQKDG